VNGFDESYNPFIGILICYPKELGIQFGSCLEWGARSCGCL